MSHSTSPIEALTKTYRGVASVETAPNYRLVIVFDNGEKRIFNVTPLLTFGRFQTLKSPEVFKKVRVTFDTVEWENGLDLDPEYLYEQSEPLDEGRAKGKPSEGSLSDSV
jgi:hypothetical protein